MLSGVSGEVHRYFEIPVGNLLVSRLVSVMGGKARCTAVDAELGIRNRDAYLFTRLLLRVTDFIIAVPGR